MKLRAWKNSDIKHGARVLLRIDANVPLVNGRVVVGTHDRIAKTLLEIVRLQARGTRLIIATHFGRPNGKQTEFSVAPIAKAIGRALGMKVVLAEDVVGKSAERLAETLAPGEIMMIENLRFDRREEKNDFTFARSLAGLADVYVNNAFGVCHRAHASVSAVTKFLPSFAGGLLREEITQLSKPMKKPFVLVVGGNKLETKVPLLLTLGKKADAVLLGSGFVNAFAADMRSVGATKVQRTLGDALRLPDDVRTTRQGQAIDIGPKTEREFARVLRGAKTIVWNGPLGIVEKKEGEFGTRALIRAIVNVKGARTIIGGGETVDVVERSSHAEDFTLLSTGGGAMLSFLSGEPMPGLVPLEI